MRVYRTFDEIEFKKNTAVTVGTFDGVHLGHQAILNRLKEISSDSELRSIVITIDPHPQIVLRKSGKEPIFILTDINERLILFEKFGIEHVLIIPFTFLFSQTSPEEFVRNWLGKIGLSKILIGHDHLFGKDRKGDIELLKRLGEKLQFDIEKVGALDINGLIISSTKIRRAILDRDIEQANKMLGYHYFVTGDTVVGNRRGAGIGFATANIKPPDINKLIPSIGVYMVSSQINGAQYYGMANIGRRPTFGEDILPAIEAHFFGIDETLYDRQITLEFLKFIREEKKFSGVDELVTQLHKDKEFCLNERNNFIY
ncbi:MAG: riboflavin biosynthesis protein RibF [Ignavibacteria bacterium]|nr:riboflavin biosynthesis protein RibF [Ignavibacteria bacterium]